MCQNVRIRTGSFFNVPLIMHYLKSFLSCSIRNLTLASLSCLFTIKIDVFALFTSFNSHSVFFFVKAITENQLHDFLINSRHSFKKYCLHSSTLSGVTITDKIWAQEGRLFRQKVVIFPSFSSVIMNFFLTSRPSFVF